MTASTSMIPTNAEREAAPRGPRPVWRGEPEDPRTDATPQTTYVPFEALLTVTQRIAVAGRGHSTDAQAAAQMYDAPVSETDARRAGARRPDDRTDPNLRSAAKSPHRTNGREPAAESGVKTLRSNNPSVTAPSAEVQTGRSSSELKPDGATVGSEPVALQRASSATSTNEPPNSSTKSLTGTPTNGVSPTAGVPPIAAIGAANEGQRGNPAQQVARILAGSRVEAAESPRAIEAGGNTGGPRPSRSDDRTAKQPTTPDEASPRNESPSSSAGEKADAARRSTPFDELVRSIRLNAGHRHSSARLQLEPKELGRLDVEVRMVGDDAEITVRTETPAARLLVRERGAELTTALERHGIHVERFEVTSGPPGDGAYAFATGDGSQGARADRGHDGTQMTRDRGSITRTERLRTPPGPDVGIGGDHTTSVLGTARRLDIRV